MHFFSTNPVLLAVPKPYSSFQHLFLEAELQKSAHSLFFKKIFVTLKSLTDEDVTLLKDHRPSTLPVPLAVPKTYSSFQHLFSEAES